jgi:hypothetical protein
MIAYPEVSPVRAIRAFMTSFLRFWPLLFTRRIRQPREHIGGRLNFADGSRAEVLQETRVNRRHSEHLALLVVEFRLRLVHGRAHRWFELLSALFIPMFVGQPGFVSKLWLAHDKNEVYRGIYEWNSAEDADAYSQNLRWILRLVSVPGSVCYQVLPDTTRPEYVAGPEELVDEASPINLDAWWRVS